MLGKRSVNDPNSEEEHDDGNTKRLKTPTADNSSSFRAWSKDVSENEDSSTVYTLKCVFGDPSNPLPSWIKSSKIGDIKAMLQSRNLSTEGKKSALLDRLQTDLPSVTLEIDSRECLQRVVNSFLYHLDWDNTHLFECKLPARGSLTAGAGNLWIQSFGIDLYDTLKTGRISGNPSHHDKRMRQHLQKKLDAAGMDWSDFDRAKREPNATGKWRKLQGSGFDPHTKPMDDFGDEEPAAGGYFSLEELALEKGDKIQMTYDFGDDNKFTIFVMEKKERQTCLAEVKLYGQETRVNLEKKSQAKMPKQYR